VRSASPILDRRRAILSRIQRRYQTVEETVRVGPLSLAFTRIADPNRVLDEVAAAVDLRERLGERPDNDHLHLPYWAELWDSAMGLAQYLVQRHSVTPLPPDVLDLGCGMGLSGTVAAALGYRVVFADMEADALLFARLNSVAYAPRVRTHRLNWQSDRLPQRFDLILGADILYERAQWQYLEPFWRGHLRPTGSVLLGEPGRQTGTLFPEWITPRGWKLATHQQTVSTRPTPIRIFKLTAS
jgi:predicted nicotinamide N-methyase